MEDFYRASRQRFQILIDGNKPVGGQWNFDTENRQPPKGKLDTPKPFWFEPDAITQEVIAQVKSLSFLTYGNIEPFRWAVTREQALQVLDNFIEQCLPAFGSDQDAMVTGEETMWPSLLSPYLNIGLLHPLEVIQAAETAYLEKNLNLNGVEGFTRPIMGWREYIRGMYFYVDANYFEKNWFNHTQPLPEFFLGRQQNRYELFAPSFNSIRRQRFGAPYPAVDDFEQFWSNCGNLADSARKVVPQCVC